jgi:acyl-coenzyme A thioesterase PaaI-like protein
MEARTMSIPFHEATRIQALAEGSFEAEVPDHWQQGRGAFGGLVFGLLVRAACATESDPARVVRSFSSDIAGPVLPGPVRLAVHTLRRGKTQTNLRAELEQGGEVLAVANLTMSGSRQVEAAAVHPSTPEGARADFRALPVMPVGPPFGPVFGQAYEYRNAGPLPFSQAPEPTSAGFVRERPGQRPAGDTLDAAAITALLDSYWPALYATTPRPVPMTTVSFAAQYLLHDEPLAADQPLFFQGRAFVQSEGYCVEFRELWTRDRLVALNQQTFAILR